MRVWQWLVVLGGLFVAALVVLTLLVLFVLVGDPAGQDERDEPAPTEPAAAPAAEDAQALAAPR